MKRSFGPCTTGSTLSESAHHRLNMYALVASAAGVGMLAMAQPSQAKIVYRPTDRVLTNGTLAIPIACTHDFTLSDKFYIITGSWSTQLLDIDVKGSASVVGSKGSASALKRGAVIGPADKFQTGKVLMAGAFRETQISSTRVFGPFANTTHRFLGLKFKVHGQVHYGWARFSSVVASAGNGPMVSATLTGYAYETMPNKPIIAGKTRGSDEVSGIEHPSPASFSAATPEPATLGLLAMGSPALSIWRRRE